MRYSILVLIATLVASASLARDARFGPPPRAADPGVQAIQLLIPASTLSVLGPHPTTNPVQGSPEIHGFPGRELTFLNKSRTQQLVLYIPPGSINLAVSEARVGPPKGDHPVFPGEPAEFTTARGIQLGLKRSQVVEIFGPPTGSSADELRYRIERELALEWLAEFNWPAYEATYSFENDILVRFTFGFPVP